MQATPNPVLGLCLTGPHTIRRRNPKSFFKIRRDSLFNFSRPHPTSGLLMLIFENKYSVHSMLEPTIASDIVVF